MAKPISEFGVVFEKIFFLFFIITLKSNLCNCINITELVFGGMKDYRPMAFGDFNSDKLTDVFVWEDEGDKGISLTILISSNEPPLLHAGPKCPLPNLKIKNVMPGDFNGDGAMDVLLVTSSTKDAYEGYLLWGDLEKLDCSVTKEPLLKFSSEPLLMDYNGDMIADLFGDDEKGARSVWVFDDQKTFTKEVLPGSPLRKPTTNAFIDVNSDLSADLWVGAEDQFELWTAGSHSYHLEQNISLPLLNTKRPLFLGQASFIDVDLNGDVEVLLPVCSDYYCKDSHIFLYNFDTQSWHDLKINLKDPDKKFWFFPDTWNIKDLYLDTVTLRIGDYNLDGFPDILTTLIDENGNPQVTLLENSECQENCDFARTFVPKWGRLADYGQSVVGTFFDFEEDGSLDIILVQKQADQKYSIAAYKDAMEYDAMFLKVLVSTGRCLDDCVFHSLPYGTNQPGVAMRYSIITATGDIQKSSATQLSQSAHMALQLPYTVFGLGRNWNFVETLDVGIPMKMNVTGRYDHSRKFTQIIPNSQVIVIPYPANDPSLWISKLFITPSKALKMTAGALIATCLFVMAIIAVLHYQERQQDRRDKLQESQRFHFDAM